MLIKQGSVELKGKRKGAFKKAANKWSSFDETLIKDCCGSTQSINVTLTFFTSKV